MRLASTTGLALALCAAVSACGGDSAPAGSPTPSGPNLLIDSGFEGDASAWAALTTESWEPRFFVASDRAHGGERSAYLKMHTDETTPATRIYGVMQEVAPQAFPEVVTGYYRVENWRREAAKQYMQVVVIVWDADNKPDASFPNHQIRYILNGIETPPFSINNARYIYLDTAEPAQDAWVPFKLDIAADFERVWGAVPAGFDSVRLLFEVRFDDKAPEQRPYADVFFDDLYIGPASGAP